MMTEHELQIVREVMKEVLAMGTPGLSEVMRNAIVSQTVRTVRHQIAVHHAPKITSSQEV
jgi:hypothetical protein